MNRDDWKIEELQNEIEGLESTASDREAMWGKMKAMKAFGSK